eukprot:scaffold24853_cov129-Isochrysis_galbana.AAC.1
MAAAAMVVAVMVEGAMAAAMLSLIGSITGGYEKTAGTRDASRTPHVGGRALSVLQRVRRCSLFHRLFRPQSSALISASLVVLLSTRRASTNGLISELIGMSVGLAPRYFPPPSS